MEIEVDLLNQQIRAKNVNLIEERRRTRPSYRSSEREETQRKTNIQYKLPEFKGDKCPLAYINQMRQYWEAERPFGN